jgi:cytochrome c oxidase assembly factor CtaG
MTGVALAAAAFAVYLAGALRARRWSPARLAAFGLGCAVLAVALWPSLDRAADARPAPHMVEHLLLGAVAPLLLAAGAPVRLALAAAAPAGRRAVGRALRHPVVHALGRPPVAVPLAIAVFVAVHVPAALDAALRSGPVHAAEHALLFYSALLMWMSMLAVDPLPAPPSPFARLAWLTLAMVAMSAVGAAYSSAAHVLVPGYAAIPHALAAQQDAGVVMWVGGGLVFVPAMIATVFAAMVREETLQRRREAVSR